MLVSSVRVQSLMRQSHHIASCGGKHTVAESHLVLQYYSASAQLYEST
jgi:hypothetical protein